MLAWVTPCLICAVCLWAGLHGHAGVPVERPWNRAAAVGAVIAVSSTAHLLLPGQPWFCR
jgi:hypothetical protein